MKRLLLMLTLSIWTPFIQAAPLAQLDPLQVTVRTVFPPDLQTVEEAVNWLLEPLGYYILTQYPAPETAKIILDKQIPVAAKLHRTMPVLHAIQLLIGEENTILLDRNHQLMTFSRGH